MPFNSPISPQTAERLVQSLPLQPGDRVLDAGCGAGEFLLEVAAHHQVHGLGVDQDAPCIASAQAAAAARGLASRCDFRLADVNTLEPGLAPFDLCICIGSTHAFGTGEAAYPNTIERLKILVRPGGFVLIGECYWKQPPAAEYLSLIGDPVGIYRTHAENVSFAQTRGLISLYSTISSDDEWDEFELRHFKKVQHEAEANPNDQALAARLVRSRQWYDGYLRWGRSTMGFGLYLFQVPGHAG